MTSHNSKVMILEFGNTNRILFYLIPIITKNYDKRKKENGVASSYCLLIFLPSINRLCSVLEAQSHCY
jgi:hypothetical protein